MTLLEPIQRMTKPNPIRSSPFEGVIRKQTTASSITREVPKHCPALWTTGMRCDLAHEGEVHSERGTSRLHIPSRALHTNMMGLAPANRDSRRSLFQNGATHLTYKRMNEMCACSNEVTIFFSPNALSL